MGNSGRERVALIITGASIDPSVTGGLVADAVAIDAAGAFCAVGAGSELAESAESGTQLVALDGAALLPGFQDAHVHPVSAGLEMTQVDLSQVWELDAYRELIARYGAEHADAEWITGGGWSMDAFPRGIPEARQLDGIGQGRPIYLPNRDHHSAWVNDIALRRAQVDANTPDPPDGRIERDATGRPTGTLHDGAMALVADLVPRPSAAELRAALLAAQRYLHSLGITGWQDALVGDGLGMADCLDAYLSLATCGELTASVVGALWWDRTRGAEQLEDLVARRARAEGHDRFRATSVKIMQDGVCETFTAAMLEPYCHLAGSGPGNGRGPSFIDPDALCEHVTRLDELGFQVHFHALGDRAVRECLDAVAAARRANGPGGARHHLAHLQVVHPDDVGRFASLGAVANAQPLWACNDQQMVELTLPHLGPERARQQYPWRALLDAGARLAIGSDWPVSTPDPRQLLYVAVTRLVPPSQRHGTWAGADASFLPDQRLTMRQAVHAYTAGTAYVNGFAGVSGAIEVGKRADLVALDVDPFRAPPDELLDAEVLLTVSNGTVVHRALGH
jgi:predicted amidohydrolase YtcJ